MIRNKEPRVITGQGLTPVTHTAGVAEIWFKLREMHVATIEAMFKSQSVEEMREQIVEQLELLRTTASLANLDMREIDSAREDKESLEGSYSKMIILDRVEKP